jgi:Cu(I)/Ag(I) efflux system membrane fusion protein/cobalt-zinc-cadmium efflux system membrane fusion protein
MVPVYEDPGGEKEPSSTIRIDPVTVQNMGVRTDIVVRRPLRRNIRSYGNVTYDETRIFTVNTKFDGWIENIYVDFEGEAVKKGQPLFDIYSPALVSAQEEYLLALQQYRSLGDSAYPHIREGAERLLRASRTRLRYWDLSKRQIERIAASGTVRKVLTVYSPASGVVVKKKAFKGHFVKAGMHQYEIADLSRVWVDVEVYEYELPWVKEGMPARMSLAYIPGYSFDGRVLFVYPYLEGKSRTARLRLAFSNHEDLLKPQMYANVELKSTLPGMHPVIPQEAVIDSGIRKVVFVDRGEGRFDPREVQVGLEVDQGAFQVLAGLEPGEKIVTSAQFMLDSESRLREAIQKMLAARNGGDTAVLEEDKSLDMEDLDMTSELDDMDMEGLTMEKSTLPTAGNGQRDPEL